ncbi:hypothetical protein [Leptospira sp. GIMC2001]|uniref:hypothetical protein n=1 Tax=Leptospira sp. GIMC2001 TaxID=1513297 RepID=UPI002348F7D1|nr:hypothetical protein [Leptospira sp. GIMC2001]WCL49047.1 hypothetical protein O4O04_17420 [Leptospira sp. GIMC2001]
MDKMIIVLGRVVFAVLNFIILFAFIVPYILTDSEEGQGIAAHFWQHPFTWILLIMFLITFPLKFYIIRSIRKKNLQFRFEFGSQCFWLLVRGFITGLWITWILNGAIYNNDILGGTIFSVSFFALIFYFYWLYSAKKMRTENTKRFMEALIKIVEIFPKPSLEEDSRLNSMLTSSELYNDKFEHYKEAVVGSPGRSFTVRIKREEVSSADYKSGTMAEPDRIYQRFDFIEWIFYFCVITDSFSSRKPGIYSKSEFITLFDKSRAELYKKALSDFNVSAIEITEIGYIISVSPSFDIASLGIAVPSEKALMELFRAFEMR